MFTLVICSIVTFFVLYRLFKPDRLKKIVKVKGGYPYLGQVFTMLKGSPWDQMTKWAMEYGGIYRIDLFGSQPVFFSDPDLLKVILNTKLSNFKKDTAWTYKPFMVILGKGIVTSDGEAWKRQRLALAHHLKIEILEKIPTVTLKIVKKLITKIEKVIDSNQVLEMAEEFRTLTLHVISDVLLSISPEECDETFAKMYLPIVTEGNLRTWHPERAYIPNSDWFKFNKDVKRLNDYVSGIISKRWELRQQESKSGDNSRVKDVLDEILSNVQPEDWGTQALEQVRDEIKTFVLAGHETSASMLAWALYELSIKEGEKCLEEVLKEGKEVYAGSGDVSSPSFVLPPKEKINTLIYTESCLKESLRKYSVVPTVVRQAVDDIKVGEYDIPAGTTIMVNMQGVHHNPKFWPEPLTYRPERFFTESELDGKKVRSEKKLEPYTFLPFVEGPRMCLGQYLSLLESKLVLSMLLQKFKFEVTNPEDAGEKHPFMIPIIPKTGHFMKISRRTA